MKRILFVTNRNILTTSGELRLIKNRAEALYENYGIPTDFIAFSSQDRINSDRKETINAGGDLQTFEQNLTNPAVTLSSYKKVQKTINSKLETGAYGAVILSGNSMAFYAKRIKRKFNVNVCLDIHGALEDILEVSRKSSGIKSTILKALFYVDQIAVKQGTYYSDGFFVVTEALKQYLKERFNITNSKQFYIVPCATSTAPINEGEYQKDRANYRKKYGIETNEIVFVYSGGVSSWQCVEESIGLFKTIADKIEGKARMLIFSHNIDEIKKWANGDTRIQTDSYSPDELFHALRVGDFAFLLRRDNLTNNVAFPNKFLEYVQSGMKIITTPYVREIAKQTKEYNLGYIYNSEIEINDLICYVNKNSHRSYSPEVVDSVLSHNCFRNTTREFAKGFLDGNSD